MSELVADKVGTRTNNRNQVTVLVTSQSVFM